MAVYDLEEQEQIDDLKAWWAQYGKYVSAAITVVAVVVIGGARMALVSENQAEQASVLYQAVSQAVAAQGPLPRPRIRRRRSSTATRGTAYAPRAALLYAKLLYDKTTRPGAKQQLQWVIDHSSEDELKAIARFRLAQALLDDKQYDEALKTLDVKTDEAFAGALRRPARATSCRLRASMRRRAPAYEIALAKIDPKSRYRAVRAGQARRAREREMIELGRLTPMAIALLLGACQSLPPSMTSWLPSSTIPMLTAGIWGFKVTQARSAAGRSRPR